MLLFALPSRSLLAEVQQAVKEAAGHSQHGGQDVSQNERAAPVGGENYFARGRDHQRNGSNHTRPRSSSRNRGRSSSKGPSGTRNRNCNFCGKPGHFKKQCYAWLQKNKEKQDSKTSDFAQSHESQDSANLSQGYDSGEVLVTSTESTADAWILDSGCTYHMTHRKDWLTDYQKIDGGKVILGDNRTCQVEGIGMVSFKMFDGIVRTLKNVRYVPRMSRNLISISVLDDLGYTCKVEK